MRSTFRTAYKLAFRIVLDGILHSWGFWVQSIELYSNKTYFLEFEGSWIKLKKSCQYMWLICVLSSASRGSRHSQNRCFINTLAINQKFIILRINTTDSCLMKITCQPKYASDGRYVKHYTNAHGRTFIYSCKDLPHPHKLCRVLYPNFLSSCVRLIVCSRMITVFRTLWPLCITHRLYSTYWHMAIWPHKVWCVRYIRVIFARRIRGWFMPGHDDSDGNDDRTHLTAIHLSTHPFVSPAGFGVSVFASCVIKLSSRCRISVI